MQTSSDNGSLSSLRMERVQPGAALEFGNRACLDGHLGAAVSHAGVETLQISLERKEAARPDVNDAGALEVQRQRAHEPAVDRRRIRGRSDDAAGDGTIGMREGCHVRIEVEYSEASSRAQDSHEFGD